MKWLALLALFSAPALAQDHENHDWLQFKMNERGQSCCSGGKSGDCQPVEFDAYTEDNKGGVNYGRFYFRRYKRRRPLDDCDRCGFWKHHTHWLWCGNEWCNSNACGVPKRQFNAI